MDILGHLCSHMIEKIYTSTAYMYREQGKDMVLGQKNEEKGKNLGKREKKPPFWCKIDFSERGGGGIV